MRLPAWIRKMFQNAEQLSKKPTRTRLYVESLEDRTVPAYFNWTGNGGDLLWNTGANWDQNGALPGSGDDVNIMTAPGNILLQDGAASVRSVMSMSSASLVVNDSLAISQYASFMGIGGLVVDGSITAEANANISIGMMGGGLDVSGQIHLGAGSQLLLMGAANLHGGGSIDGAGVVNFGFGTLSVADSAIIQNLDVNGGNVQGPGVLTITGSMNFSSGSLAGSHTTVGMLPYTSPGIPGILDVAPGAALNFTAYGTKTIDEWTVNGYGAIDWAQGDVNNYDSTVNIATGSAFTISTSWGTWRDSLADGQSSINNAGTLTKAAGGMMGMPVSIEAELNSTTSIEIAGGLVSLQGGGELAGLLDIQGNASLFLRNGVFVAQALSQAVGLGQGTLVVDGSTSQTLNLIIAAAPVLGIPSVSLQNVELRTGGQISGAGNLEIRGSLTWIGGTMSGAGQTTLAQGAIMTVSGNVNLTRNVDGAGDVVVSGGLSWSAGTMNGPGTTTINAGAFLQVAGSVTSSRNIENRGRTTIDQDDSLTLEGVFSNFAFFDMYSGSLMTGGTFLNSPNVPANNVAIVKTSIPAFPAGTARFSSILINRAAVIVNTGTLTFTNVIVNNNAGSGYLVPAGSELRFTGASPVTFSAGSVIAGPGNVLLGAPMVVGAGETLEIQNLTFNAVQRQISGPGILKCEQFDWQSGRLGAGLTVQVEVGNTLTIGGRCVINDASIMNNGTINWTGVGNLTMSTSALIKNDGTDGEGTFNVLTASDIIDDTPVGSVSNPTIAVIDDAVFTMGAGSGGNNVQAILVNKFGEVNLNDRSLRLNRGLEATDPAIYAPIHAVTDLGGNQGQLIITSGLFTQTGGSTILAGGTIQASNVTVISGTLALGGGTVDLSPAPGGFLGTFMIEASGFVTGGGSIIANVMNLGTLAISNGTMVANPTLDVCGNYIQGANGVLNLTIGGAANYDRLIVCGDVTLNGTLNMALDNYVPGNGLTFDVLFFAGQGPGQFNQILGPGNNIAWTLDYNTPSYVKVRS